MKLVDPRKLDRFRETVDGAIAEMVLTTGRTRRECLLSLGKDFGYCVEFFKVDDWYLATAQPANVWNEIDLYHKNADFDRCAEVDIASRRNHVAIASTAEIAAIALHLQMLDDDVDLFFSEQDVVSYYPANSIADHEGRIAAVENYIRQERWFGDIPQCGRVEDTHRIVVSDDGRGWSDGYGNKV